VILPRLKDAARDGLLAWSREEGLESPPPVSFAPAPAHVAESDIAVAWPMAAAKALRRKPLDIAAAVSGRFAGFQAAAGLPETDSAAHASPPGFLNLRLGPRTLAWNLLSLLRAPEDYGRFAPAEPRDILLEFVSANPTGPVHLASSRAATLGDSLARILRRLGHRVRTEYYVNDAIDPSPDSSPTWLSASLSGNNLLAANQYYQIVLNEAGTADGDLLKALDKANPAVYGTALPEKKLPFKTQNKATPCDPASVTVKPNPHTAKAIGERAIFSAAPYSAPNACSQYGQALSKWKYSYAWSTKNPAVAKIASDFNTAYGFQPYCTAACLPKGSDVASDSLDTTQPLCGSNVIEAGEDCEIDDQDCTLSCLFANPANHGLTGSGPVPAGQPGSPVTTCSWVLLRRCTATVSPPTMILPRASSLLASFTLMTVPFASRTSLSRVASGDGKDSPVTVAEVTEPKKVCQVL